MAFLPESTSHPQRCFNVGSAHWSDVCLCWASIADDCPTSNKNWINDVSCLLGLWGQQTKTLTQGVGPTSWTVDQRYTNIDLINVSVLLQRRKRWTNVTPTLIHRLVSGGRPQSTNLYEWIWTVSFTAIKGTRPEIEGISPDKIGRDATKIGSLKLQQTLSLLLFLHSV